jgi:hypothetical protein
MNIATSGFTNSSNILITWRTTVPAAQKFPVPLSYFQIKVRQYINVSMES